MGRLVIKSVRCYIITAKSEIDGHNTWGNITTAVEKSTDWSADNCTILNTSRIVKFDF